jgi:hypothetical protein
MATQLTVEQRTFLEMIQELDKDKKCTFSNKFPNTTRIVLKQCNYTDQGAVNMNKLGIYYLRWRHHSKKPVAGGTP